MGVVSGVFVRGRMNRGLAGAGRGDGMVRRACAAVSRAELAEQRQQEQARGPPQPRAPGRQGAASRLPLRSAASAISTTSAAAGSGYAAAYTTGVSVQRTRVRSASCSAMTAAIGGEIS